MTLDDFDVHEPFCKYCYQCQWCLGDKDGECDDAQDGRHKFVWSDGSVEGQT